MKCPRCQHENSPGHKFCPECGTALQPASGSVPPTLSFADLQRCLTETQEQQTATTDILRVISSSPTDVQPVFDTIVTSAGRLCGAESAVVYRFEDEMADAVAFYNLNPEATEAYHRRFPRRLHDTDHLWRVADGSVLNIANIAADPNTSTANETFRARGARGFVLVPMVREGQAIGAIGVSHHDVGAFSDE